MLKRLFRGFLHQIKEIRRKSKFLTAVWRSVFYKRFVRKYWNKLFYYYNLPTESNNFFKQNAERVNAIANMLADELSKTTYIGMIRFRTTYKKKDFPLACYNKIQYFIDELRFDDDEVFCDCGAFDGDTVDMFLKYCPAYKQIIAFEPEAANFKKLEQKYGDNNKIMLIKAGAYDRDGEVLFTDEGGSNTSKVIDASMNNETNAFPVINVKTIDGLDLEKVTFIKMDIEGAELNALVGAKKTILRDKPKLAICIYHSDDDMLQIAEYIHDLVPEYEFYVRQHNTYPCMHETVLYALPLAPC